MAATAGGRVHPRIRAGGGARKIRVPHQRDEVDCGRGRSEQSERSSSCGWRPDGPEPWPGDKKRGWLSVSRLFSQPLNSGDSFSYDDRRATPLPITPSISNSSFAKLLLLFGIARLLGKNGRFTGVGKMFLNAMGCRFRAIDHSTL